MRPWRRTKQRNITNMRRAVERQHQVKNENPPDDSGPPLPHDSRYGPSRNGVWKYAECFGVNPSLALMARRYVNFGIVGAIGMGVDMAALFVLADPRMMHLNLSLGKALAAEIAVFNNFTWNELWTFRDWAVNDPSWRGRAARLGRFNLICLAGVALSVLLLYVQTRFLDMNMYVGNLVTIVLVSLWNFGMSQKFGWKRDELK
jgi:putative flippase GtrA